VFVGVDAAIDRLVEHLERRRERRVDPFEPTGVLTHHLDFAPEAWSFLDEVLARTVAHPAVRWVDVREAFVPVGAASIQGGPVEGARRRGGPVGAA
jgi:hypothetical protein